MSRIGKQPVVVPSGVQAEIKSDSVVLKSNKGSLSLRLNHGVKVLQDADKLIVSVANSDKQSRADYGTTRALLNNMVHGLTTGWKRVLEMNGVGFTAKSQGNKLILAVGFSHDVTIDLPKEIKCTINKNIIELESADKQLLATYASKIRDVQPPEPYLGKGIKYAEEKIRRKAGKTAKK